VFLMHNCHYLIGYRIFVYVEPTCDFSVFPEKDSTVCLCRNVLYGDTLQFVEGVISEWYVVVVFVSLRVVICYQF